MNTIEDFRTNKIQNNLLTSEEFKILAKANPADLEYFSGYGVSGQIWIRNKSPIDRNESLVYRYNPNA
jgi:hypothetical protein